MILFCGMYGRVPEPWLLRSDAPIVTQTNQIYVYMQIVSIVTQTTQIYVYMEVVRGRLGEICVHIALQASPFSCFITYFSALSCFHCPAGGRTGQAVKILYRPVPLSRILAYLFTP